MDTDHQTKRRGAENTEKRRVKSQWHWSGVTITYQSTNWRARFPGWQRSSDDWNPKNPDLNFDFPNQQTRVLWLYFCFSSTDYSITHQKTLSVDLVR
jgi:hypothetical protein